MIRAAFNLAEFWQVDPELEMERPLSRVVEHFDQATRINKERAQPG